ncbi:MAG: hypothetical protein U0326_28370 [Polyangiales bacterium]
MGAVWFEALTGRRAIDGASYHEIMATLLAGSPPDLRAHTAHLPAGVRSAIEGALRVDRTRRHASMSAFARALLTDPSLASEPWIKALSDEHPFAANAPSMPVFEARSSSPITLDLPTPDSATAHAETLSSGDDTPPPAPPPAPMSAPVTASSVMHPRWPAVTVAVLALALTGAWLARPTTPPATSVTPTSVTPTSITTAPSPAAATSARTPEASAPDAATTPSASPVVEALDAAAPPADALVAAVVRHAPRIRVAPISARDASVERATHAEINGAPVLEP